LYETAGNLKCNHVFFIQELSPGSNTEIQINRTQVYFAKIYEYFNFILLKLNIFLIKAVTLYYG